MRKRNRIGIGLALALAALSARAAGATTLADLAAGASFTTTNHVMRFSDFTVRGFNLLNVSLADYAVTALGNGFTVSGPLSLSGKGLRGIDLGYRVTAADGVTVTSAGLSFDAFSGSKRATSLALEKLFFDDGTVSPLLSTLAKPRANKPFDLETLSSGMSAFSAGTQVRVFGRGNTFVRSFSQTFGFTVPFTSPGFHVSVGAGGFQASISTVPEPATALLLGAGLAALAARRRRA